MNAPNPNLDAAKTLLAGMANETAELQPSLHGPVTDTAAGWLASEYALAAHQKLAGVEDSGRWEILRAAVQDLSLLRRGDLTAARLQLDREELDWLRAKTKAAKEKEFWQWIKLPKIHRKLFPKRKRHLRQATIRKARRMLGMKPSQYL